MGMFEELNKHGGNSILPEDVDLMNIEFKPLRDFIGEEFKLGGFFFSNGQFGEQVALYAKTKNYQGGVKINVPNRYVEVFRTILNTKGAKENILNGKVLITNIKMIATKKGQATATFEFKDC